MENLGLDIVLFRKSLWPISDFKESRTVYKEIIQLGVKSSVFQAHFSL